MLDKVCLRIMYNIQLKEQYARFRGNTTNRMPPPPNKVFFLAGGLSVFCCILHSHALRSNFFGSIVHLQIATIRLFWLNILHNIPYGSFKLLRWKGILKYLIVTHVKGNASAILFITWSSFIPSIWGKSLKTSTGNGLRWVQAPLGPRGRLTAHRPGARWALLMGSSRTHWAFSLRSHTTWLVGAVRLTSHLFKCLHFVNWQNTTLHFTCGKRCEASG